jgi:chondroitin-sulfate-ABC endolyase/exolyase
LQRQCDYFLWNWGSEVIFADADPPSYTDYYIRVVPRLLQACLLQPEPIEQVRWLRAFKLMLERSMLQPTSALKIDGCTYHKGGHFHDGYYGVTALAQTVQKLSGTPWRLSAEAHERLRRAALAQRLFCNRLDVPLPLCGIQPFFVTLCPYIFPDGLDCLARSGTPDGKQVFDKEVGTAYLRLAYSGTADYEPYRALNLEPEPAPNGCFVMPYAALLSHRRDNWLASVHGQSKYVAGTERQTRWNRFALFQGLGCLEILAGGDPVGARPSGRQESGWDWRHYEGTTAPQLPLNKIDKGWTSPYSPETFVGGLSHQGRQGMFAMIVNQPMPGKKTLKGRKSWFFNDNRILCLGSNISCDETDYPTQTTLCQRGLRKNQITSLPSMDQIGNLLQTCLDGEDINGLPEERALDETKPHWFLDVQQTGYYLPAGQKATVTRRHQTRRDCMNLQDREGDFLTAWLDHGKAPRSASYEYLLAVRATPEAMRKLAADPPYRLVQRDQAAHVVWDTTGRRWNCILFVPQKVTPHTVATEVLPVKNVDRPCLVMADAVWGGQFAMTVADPDLNLETPKSEGGASALGPLPLRVTLRGVWRLLEATGTVCAWRLPKASENVRVLSSSGTETVLEIFCQHGASWEIRLAQR